MFEAKSVPNQNHFSEVNFCYEMKPRVFLGEVIFLENLSRLFYF